MIDQPVSSWKVFEAPFRPIRTFSTLLEAVAYHQDCYPQDDYWIVGFDAEDNPVIGHGEILYQRGT